MKRIKRLRILLSCLLLAGLGTGCEKFLGEKPDKKLVVPEKLADLQAVIDNYTLTNYNGSPGSGEVSADDYYLTDADWSALSQESFRRMYTWEKDYIFTLTVSNDWHFCFSSIYHSNTVLDGISKIGQTAANQTEWNSVKGQALILRGNTYLDAAQIWCLAYDESTADQDAGMPLRLNTDFNEVSVRSTVRQTYNQVISDLKEAASLLPALPVYVMRGSKAAAYALLSRTYLSMRKYTEAGLYADSCLALNAKLLDYNSLNTVTAYPLPGLNAEVLTERGMFATPTNNTRAKIDIGLYNSYAGNDLRKTLFFKDNGNASFAFRGSYEGNSSLYNGAATDEIYLVKAECLARENKLTEALNMLNTLLRTRWKTGTYVNKTIANTPNVLDEIILERRKELLMRGLRWMDLKRLNKEGRSITLTRVVKGQTYTLPPNDKRYALSIPEDVIALSGMAQNPR